MNFRSVICISVIFYAICSGAATPVKPSFRCETELPTTTMEILPANTSEGDLKFRVSHHFGLKNLPIASGVITNNDFAYLQAKAEVLKKLGESFSVPLKSKNCEKFADDVYSCFSAEPFEINGTKVSGYNFTTRVVNTKVYDYDFKSHQVVFSFYYQGMGYDMPMNYSPEECKFK